MNHLKDGVDGWGLVNQNLETEGDPVCIISSDGLARKSGLAQVKDRREHEHRFGGEPIHFSVGKKSTKI